MAIQKETMLRSADNSGALKLKCFHIIGSSRKRLAVVGELIKCAVKDAAPGMPVKKGEIVTCVVVRTRCSYRRKDGSVIRFDDNACVVIEKDKRPKGTRVFGPVARELKENGYSRIVSLASEVV